MKRVFFFSLLSLILQTQVYSQMDTVVCRNGERFIGKIQRLDRSILSIESQSGKEELKINWKSVIKVNTSHPLRIIDEKREVFEAILRDSISNDDSLIVILKGKPRKIAYMNILGARKLESKFREKLNFNVNLGYSFSKGNNTQQLSFRSSASYLTERWSLDADYNRFITIIDTLQNSRMDASLNNRYLLRKNWFSLVSFNWFSSDEQELDLRTTIMAGGGRYLLLDQTKSLQFSTGIALNHERFAKEVNSVNESYEAFIGGTYHLFDHEFLNIQSGFVGYASLTEKDRFRASYNLNFGWDIAKNFDVLWGYSLNYDSNAPNNSQQTDYVISLTFGWSL